MLTVFILTVLVLAALAAESMLVRAWVRAIPVRVHVGGTRGKSSVTLYVTAALRHGGSRVMGKITGVVPTVLEPDGSRTPVRRRGPARLREQISMIHRARRLRCDTLVLECMSIAPALQSAEAFLFSPSLSVLTNIREDHGEEYGLSPGSRIDGLCAFIPAGGMLLSGESIHAEAVERLASKRGVRIVTPVAEDEAAARRLPEGGHRENARLAFAVCRTLGIAATDAFDGIAACIASMESELIRIPSERGEIRFLNGFAVNDISSAQQFIEAWRAKLSTWTTTTILLNTRSDRPVRTLQFARWCATVPDLRQVVVLGSNAPRARRELLAAGIGGGHVMVWRRKDAADPMKKLEELKIGPGDVVVGIGNISGDGFTILEGVRR